MKAFLLAAVMALGMAVAPLTASATVTTTVFVINTPICPSRTIGPDGAGNTWEQHKIAPTKCQVTVTQDDSSE